MLVEWAQRHGISQAAFSELATIFYQPAFAGGDASESRVQSELRLTAASMRCSLWRNNSGAVTDDTGRLVRYGLGHDSAPLNKVWKSSDLIGITPVAWHGKVFGVFTAVEVKAQGWRGPKNDHERAQGAFLANVEALGGIGLFATSKDDYTKRLTS